MKPDRWQRLQELFEAAVELGPEQRKEYLDQACMDDPVLQSQVESMILSSSSAGSFLEGALRKVAGSLVESETESAEGKRIGHYRIVRSLGRGGMGEVYLAVRADAQYQKQVAIKLVRAGMDSPDMIVRFRSERQILANLEHPNIARLLDGGTTESGLPYVVMEYVDGEPLGPYCESRSLNITDRLKLFLSICSAVQYAHRNLIVHRDIKPGNILVTADGVPKLLDFGIAKLLKPQGSEGDAVTRTAVRLLTPEYASPEQIRAEPITTASDVYSMGVVLYELLTGRRPYRLHGSDARAIERAICEEDPEKPSTAVTRAPAADLSRSKQAGRRQAEKLKKELAGDLDNIVLMAMRKEQARRYASVEQLAEDIRRYLEGFPVLARKDTWSYRSGKFIRRHATGVGVAAAAALLLVAFGVSMYVQAIRVARERDTARRERETAEQISRFLQETFKVSDPSEARGNSVTAREILDRGAERIARELGTQPAVQATLMDTIGRVYQSLGIYSRAARLIEQALETRRRIVGDEHPETAQSLHNLATVLYAQGDYDQAERFYRQVIPLRRSILGDEHQDVAQSLNKLAGVLRVKGSYAESEALFHQALALRRKLFGAEHVDVAESLNRMAQVIYDKGDYATAEPLYRESLSIRRKLLREHPDVADTLNNLALLVQRRGLYEEAERLFRESLAMHRKLEGDEHPEVANSLGNLAALLRTKGDYEAAEPLVRKALSLRRSLFGEENDRTARSMVNLAQLLYAKGDYAASEPVFRQATLIFRKKMGNDHPDVARSLNGLAMVLHAKGDDSQAEPLLREALALRRKRLGERHAEVAESLGNLAAVLHARGDVAAAEPLYRESLQMYREKLSSGHPQTAHPLAGLGVLLTQRLNAALGEPLLREALEIRRKTLPEGHWQIAEAESALGACLTARGSFQEAKSLLVDSYEIYKAKFGERARPTRQALVRLKTLNDASVTVPPQ